MDLTNTSVHFEFSSETGVARIVLQASKKLNALDTGMLKVIQTHLLQWKEDPKVTLILFSSSSPRAFCAGGDVKKLILDYQAQGLPAAEEFFTTEYFTDYLVHTIAKPTMALLNGITMGGGLGIINGARHKITTPGATMAMPEISIGLFPDVGASYFLTRTPNGFGRMLGLTGFRITGEQAVQLKFADHLISEDNLPKIQDLSEIKSYEIPMKHNYFSEEENRFLSLWSEDFEDLERQILSFKAETVRVIEAVEFFRMGSPLSRRLIHRQLLKAEKLSLRECFLMEWSMALNCCLKGDFPEGVRAKLIDKSGQPNWKTKVPPIEEFFLPPEGKNGLEEKLNRHGL